MNEIHFRFAFLMTTTAVIIEMEQQQFEDVGNSKKSFVWQYFRLNKMEQKGKCNLCSRVLKATGGSTKNLLDHLKNKHEITSKRPAAFNDDNNEATPTKICRIDTFFKKKESLGECLCHLICVEGLNFNQIATSERLRAAFKAKGYDFPKSAHTLTNIFFEEVNRVKAIVKNEIAVLKRNSKRFTITLDESTSIRNRRYLNINLHCKDQFYSLGMIRILGSMPAEKAIELVRKRLLEYDLDLNTDIICAMSDGASVMKKFGRLIAPVHITCLAHAIHLCVCDVLYKKIPTPANDQYMCDSSSDESNESCVESDDDDDDDDIPIMMIAQAEGAPSKDFNKVVAKVRTIVKLFRKSPVQNDDYLQRYVIESLGHEMVLFLDCKTRWNSTLKMLKRFYELRKEIRTALLNMEKDLTLSCMELNFIKEFVDALAPLELAVNYLCRGDANLLQSEKIILFASKKLEALNTDVSRALKQQLSKRFLERRNPELIHLMEYLKSPEYANTSNGIDHFGVNVNKKYIKQLAQSLLFRIFPQSLDAKDTSFPDTVANSIDDDQLKDLDADEVMSKELDSFLHEEHRSETVVKTWKEIVKQECALFESTKRRPENLENLYQALLTAKPTSVEPERAFSVMNFFLNKIRNRMSDRKLDAMIWMRQYLKKNTNSD